MKKLFAGFLFIMAFAGLGCLGEAETEILGNWVYNGAVNPADDNVYWEFRDDGTFIVENFSTGIKDTGNYELFMNGTHRMFSIKNLDTDIQDHQIPIEGEWYIVKLDYSTLICGTKDYGGFTQRDLTR